MPSVRLRSTAPFLLVITVSIVALTSLSGSSQQSPPRQAPELKVLDAWTGRWSTVGKLYDTPYSRAGDIRITMTCGWSAYSGYMICDHLITGPSGKRNDLSIYTYNETDKSYKFCGFDRTGVPRATPLSIEGPVWSYDSDEEEKGKKIHIKTINDFSKPGIVTWNTKFTDDGGAHWTLMNEGVDTRTQ
jgi:hypothetical protein